MSESPLISIIVPCYNYGHFLAETLESVLRQTYGNWECIIVDDGSTDSTKEVANSYIAKDKRFKYLFKTNGGLSSARNAGLMEMKGEFIQLLDADDLIEEKKLEVQLEFLQRNPSMDIVYGDMIRFMNENPEVKFFTNPDKDYKWMPRVSGRGNIVMESMIFDNIMVVSSPLIRKKVIETVGLFNEKLRAVEDWEYWLRCCCKNISFEYLSQEQTLTLIRTHPGSMMKNTINMINNKIEVRNMMKPFLQSNKIFSEINKVLLTDVKGQKALFYAKQKKVLSTISALLSIKSFQIFYFFYHCLYWLVKKREQHIHAAM